VEPKYQQLLADLIRTIRIAALGTIREGNARLSMVPFAFSPDFSMFYILTSELAMHTHDMQKNKNISLLIAQPDDGREDPLTLARVELRAQAEIMQVGEPGYTPARTLYIERFPMAAPLFEFGDFRLWRITLKGGRFVAGFAKAFNLTPQSVSAVSGAA
jgi:putative heme iron utilization protein